MPRLWCHSNTQASFQQTTKRRRECAWLRQVKGTTNYKSKLLARSLGHVESTLNLSSTS